VQTTVRIKYAVLTGSEPMTTTGLTSTLTTTLVKW